MRPMGHEKLFPTTPIKTYGKRPWVAFSADLIFFLFVFHWLLGKVKRPTSGKECPDFGPRASRPNPERAGNGLSGLSDILALLQSIRVQIGSDVSVHLTGHFWTRTSTHRAYAHAHWDMPAHMHKTWRTDITANLKSAQLRKTAHTSTQLLDLNSSLETWDLSSSLVYGH